MKKKIKNTPTEKSHRVAASALPTTPTLSQRYFSLIGLAAVMLLGILIYSNSFNCSFHFDDLWNIVENPAIRNLSNVSAWWNFSTNRPIAFFTFALNYHYSKLDVWSWHLFNLSVHLINACLVWWLTLLILSTPALREHPILKHKKTMAIVMALLFVSHPLATQSVTYIVQRMSSMVAMFYLLSLALYTKGRLLEGNSVVKYGLFAGAFGAMALALLTKENAYTLPLAIVLFEICFLQTRKFSMNWKDRRIVAILVVLAGVFLFALQRFSLNIFKPIAPTLGNNFTVTSQHYLFTQFNVIVQYIQLLLLPLHQNLDHDIPLATNFFELKTLLSFLFLSALLALAVWLFNKNRLISFGIFWFFLTLSIESSIVPITDLMFEHRTYLPSFGYFLILCTCIFSFLWEKYQYVAIALLLLMIGSNSALTYARNKVWKDDVSLWTDVAAKSPARSRAYYGRGSAYDKLKQTDKAVADYSKAIELNPNFAQARYNRGILYNQKGNFAEAIADYTQAITNKPDYKDVYTSRGLSYAATEQWDLAIADYSKAISLYPRDSAAYSNRGIAYKKTGQLDKALADYTKAIELSPKFSRAYNNRGNTYSALGEWDKAIVDYNQALILDPNYANAYFNRAVAYSKLEQWEKSLADYNQVIKIDPKNSAAVGNRDFARSKVKQAK